MGGECSYIVWVQVGPMRKLTLWPQKTYSVHTNTACLLNIINANRTSVGIFYCALLNGAMLNMGNGSVLEVSDPITSEATLEVLVPVDWQEAPSSPVPLLCLVSGLDPSQARVYWEVEGKVQSSERLPEVQSEKPATVRVQLSVPGHTWAEGEEITCVMESTSGVKMNKTVSRMGMERSRQGMFLAISLGGMCILLSIVVIVITLYVCRLKHDPRKKRFQAYEHNQDGAQGLTEVQYASLKFGAGRGRPLPTAAAKNRQYK
ncbi:uncharacterized protein LOC109901450 isoform X2 [Oncorhynchus kisutch]|nr:uncharacterized protein LOC109901450 isoform X2 [Oncorhynchus kisutch]